MTDAYAGFSAVQQTKVEHVAEHGWTERILDGWEALGIWGIPLLTVLILITLFTFRRSISRSLVVLLGKFTGGKDG